MQVSEWPNTITCNFVFVYTCYCRLLQVYLQRILITFGHQYPSYPIDRLSAFTTGSDYWPVSTMVALGAGSQIP